MLLWWVGSISLLPRPGPWDRLDPARPHQAVLPHAYVSFARGQRAVVALGELVEFGLVPGSVLSARRYMRA